MPPPLGQCHHGGLRVQARLRTGCDMARGAGNAASLSAWPDPLPERVRSHGEVATTSPGAPGQAEVCPSSRISMSPALPVDKARVVALGQRRTARPAAGCACGRTYRSALRTRLLPRANSTSLPDDHRRAAPARRRRADASTAGMARSPGGLRPPRRCSRRRSRASGSAVGQSQWSGPGSGMAWRPATRWSLRLRPPVRAARRDRARTRGSRHSKRPANTSEATSTAKAGRRHSLNGLVMDRRSASGVAASSRWLQARGQLFAVEARDARRSCAGSRCA